jgi:hypothetical protein
MNALRAVPDGTTAKVAQVCMVVANLEDALRAHSEIADCGTFQIWTYDQEFYKGCTYRGEPTKYAARIALNDRDPQLEYVELLQGPSIFHEHVEAQGYGVHHLGYVVDDVGAVTARMEAAGHPMVQHTYGWGLDGDGEGAFYDTRAVLGVFTEVVSRAARRRPPHATFPAA